MNAFLIKTGGTRYDFDGVEYFDTLEQAMAAFDRQAAYVKTHPIFGHTHKMTLFAAIRSHEYTDKPVEGGA